MPLDPSECGCYVRFNVPEWFAREDFMAWLNDPESNVATWHKLGQPANEHSDVFFTYDHGEGSEFSSAKFPEAIAEAIRKNLGDGEYCLIWLTNLPENDDGE